MTKRTENRDNIFGLNVPRGPYAIAGLQMIKSADSEVRGKKPTDGSPMYIGLTSPGIASTDEEWKRTYGSTLDAFLSLINGQWVQNSIDDISLDGIYRDGTFNADDGNILKKTDSGKQQITYIVSKNTLNAGSEATESYGELNEGRGLGLRVPAIAGGWGRTIDGTPTDPDPADDRKNDEEHKLARETWKYGPVEMRWDYRKGVWAAFNELIEDHYDTGLGTWVFGTNDDPDNGYPFLRGKLEDVWWVRQPLELAGSDGRQEGIKTGRIHTHLDHYWFDEDEDGAAPLKSIFIIPHSEDSTDDCHEAGEEHELGNETTGQDERIDLRHDVHFFKEKGKDGPIEMEKKASEVEMCCRPSAEKYFTGTMLFLDVEPETCPNSAGSLGGTTTAIAVTTDQESRTCKWVPAVQIDECQLVGKHFLNLANNDYAIANQLNATCNGIAAWSETMTGSVNANFAATAVAIDCLNDALAVGVGGASAAIINYASQNFLLLRFWAEQLCQSLKNFEASINAALSACDCTSQVVYSCVFPDFINPPNAVTPGDCGVIYGPVAAYDCNNCAGVEIKGPCTEEKTQTVGAPCGVAGSIFTTTKGECQIHED